MVIDHNMIENIMSIVRSAGQEMIKIYHEGLININVKSDDTPVTQADLLSDEIIYQGLKKLFPHIPIISEERYKPTLSEKKKWEYYWLVDPLDGTQEFIDGSHDFAISLALMQQHQPIFGIVYVPFTDVFYYAVENKGAFKLFDGVSQNLCISHKKNTSIRFVVSRRQNMMRFKAHIDPNLDYKIIKSGSAALKCCLVADNIADVYVRVGPTGEWDTAAAFCILKEAGGQLCNWHFELLRFNLRQDCINPNFFALGDPNIEWSTILFYKNDDS